MNKSISIILAVALLAIALAIYNLGDAFSQWTNPYDIADSIGKKIAGYMGENLTNEGLLYPADDLHDPLLASRTIVLGDGLNNHTAKGVIRKLLYLNAVDNVSPITLYVSTRGGWYHATFSIIDTFHAIQAPVNTVCVGGCYSAGLVLVASGTGVRTAYAHALFSVHLAYGYTQQENPLPYSQEPDNVNPYLRSITNLPEEWFPLDDDRHYYLNAEQALEYNIVDRIEGK